MLCKQAERGKAGAALWSHVRVVVIVMQDGGRFQSRGESVLEGGQPRRGGLALDCH